MKHSLWILALVSTPGHGLGLFIHGAKTKAHAGGGLFADAGAPALYTNPANLAPSSATEIYSELGALHLTYSFAYPGADTYDYRTSTAIPYVGFAQSTTPEFSWGFVLLPLPNSVSRVQLNSILTRETGDEPVQVNVTRTGGKKPGVMAALGFSYRPVAALSFGLALNVDQHDLREKTSSIDGQLLRDLSVQDSDRRLRFGMNYQVAAFTIASAIVPWRQFTEKGDLKQLSVPDWDYETVNDRETGPTEWALGVSWQAGDWACSLETVYTRWTMLGRSHGLAVDYLDTWDRSLALGFRKFTLGLGYYPQNIGDGLLKTRTVNYKEIKGFSYGELESLPRSVYSLGYAFAEGQSYLLYERGSRSVAESAKAYGEHRLDLWMLGASWHFKL